MRYVAVLLVAWPLVMSASVGAEPPRPPDRPIVMPQPSTTAVTEAERQLEEFMQKRRREMKLVPPETPDLGYDLSTAIQQRAIEKALPR